MARLAQLEQESQGGQARYEEEQQNLSKLLEEHRIVAAPVRVLSDDVLSEIFMVCMGVEARPTSPAGIPVGMNLSWVCKRWRAVCVTSPCLWSQIVYTAPRDFTLASSRKTFINMLNIVDLYQLRSAACPLHVTINMLNYPENRFDRDLDDAGNNDELDRLRRAIASSADRWKSLDIICFPHVLRRVHEWLGAGSLNALASLEKLKVDLHGRYNTLALAEFIPESSEPLELFAVAPKLRHVDLAVGTTEFKLPWEQIESWRGALPSIGHFADLLRRSPRITTCKLHIESETEVPYGFVHHDLRALGFRSRGDRFQQILGSLQLPSLVDLRILLSGGTGGNMHWSQRTFSQFLQRSSCLLQRLMLHDVSYFTNTEELLEVLESVPSLIELECAERDSERSPAVIAYLLFERLTTDSAITSALASTTLPNLRTLSLMGSFWHDVPNLLIPMLKSRLDRPSPLKSFYLQLYPWPFDLNAKRAEIVKVALADTSLEIVIVDAFSWVSIAFPRL
ncbi:hypothetical protein HWV62_11317 [Athelia sp. TMB]|nr:hypothetical protein HWV62_11317 [Athelia sp. TMB]